MTSADLNYNLVPVLEKLEWVTPKVALMVTEERQGKLNINWKQSLHQVQVLPGRLFINPCNN